jgi:hypothetical protein
LKTLEVFTGSCRLCEAAVHLVHDCADPTEYSVEVKSIDGAEAKAYGLSAVPSIVLAGIPIFERLPSKSELQAALS